MAKFKFYIEEQISCWRSLEYEVDSDSYEEAEEIMKKELENDELPNNYFISSHIIEGTDTYKDGTRELYDANGNEIT